MTNSTPNDAFCSETGKSKNNNIRTNNDNSKIIITLVTIITFSYEAL